MRLDVSRATMCSRIVVLVILRAIEHSRLQKIIPGLFAEDIGPSWRDRRNWLRLYCHAIGSLFEQQSAKLDNTAVAVRSTRYSLFFLACFDCLTVYRLCITYEFDIPGPYRNIHIFIRCILRSESYFTSLFCCITSNFFFY